ncbi:hypothetical protein GCM10023176_36180 [Micromonospora coerulea]|uniref:Uncharacterized protein n=1 Tax=Micromonospora coerulea TaxID=47856 RepID=A0ABP8SNG9_9ACTN
MQSITHRTVETSTTSNDASGTATAAWTTRRRGGAKGVVKRGIRGLVPPVVRDQMVVGVTDPGSKPCRLPPLPVTVLFDGVLSASRCKTVRPYDRERALGTGQDRVRNSPVLTPSRPVW